MTDKVKILIALSVFVIIASIYQIVTHDTTSSKTFLVIYCALIILFNRDKAISKNKIAMVTVIITLICLLLKSGMAWL